MAGTIFVIIVVAFGIGVGAPTLYGGCKSGYIIEILLGVLLLAISIGYGVYESKSNICDKCYYYRGEEAYCENCGKPSDHYKKTLICPDCNVEVDSNYCQNCGISRDEIEINDDKKDETTPICAECDTELSDEANFCPNCGTEVTGEL